MRYLEASAAPTRSLRLGRFELRLDRTLLMGVLNVTPDSFSDGGTYLALADALEGARRMVADGADVIDVGGESTRPGARSVGADEELRRVLPVVEGIVRELDVPVSIDTRKADVARRCLAAGAAMVNDVSGLRDRAMASTVAESGAAVVIMHMKGEPATMAQEAVYGDLLGEVKGFLQERAAIARAAGVETIVLDPGIGFAKDMEHNLELLRRLAELGDLGCPILIGPSRKRFLGLLTGRPPQERLEATLAAVVAGALNGADIVRVHDVAACKLALLVADAIRRA